MTVEVDIQKACIKLLIDQPLIGQLILHLRPTPVTWCSTAATDGRHFYYNHDFIQSLDRQQLIFLLGHETFHVVFDHIFRRGNRDKAYWNMAIDFLVNDALKKAKVGQMPDGGLYKPEYSSDEFTSEELYALLEKTVEKIEMPLDMHLEISDCQSSDEDGPPNLSEDEIKDIQDTMKSIVLQAAQQINPGKIPAGLRRMIDKLQEPKIDWREMLDTTLRSTIKYDYTYTRLSRRSYTDIVLPGQDVMDKVVAVAFLDGSGSTTQTMITDFLRECKGIMTSFRDFELTVGTFDTKVYNVKVYTPDNGDEIDEYEFLGGGGTSPSCCWKYMKRREIMPHKLLIFTDGLVGDDWGDSDYADTLFIIHSNPQIVAPYGVSVAYDPNPS